MHEEEEEEEGCQGARPPPMVPNVAALAGQPVRPQRVPTLSLPTADFVFFARWSLRSEISDGRHPPESLGHPTQFRMSQSATLMRVWGGRGPPPPPPRPLAAPSVGGVKCAGAAALDPVGG